MEITLEKRVASMLSPQRIVSLCAVEHSETKMGYMRVKFKKHRWYPHQLKNKDPLILSIGWRQFQTIPVYITEDEGHRLRMVKYTPKFGYCYALFYGPLCEVRTSFIGVQSLDDNSSHFRLCANGVVVEVNHNFPVMKKLKLIGYPYQIFKNTAFIKGMFTSDLEVSRYEGAQIKTVSGVRGQIKKSLVSKGNPDGSYRATFEDKIMKSDIITCRTWYQLELPRFYNPVFGYGK